MNSKKWRYWEINWENKFEYIKMNSKKWRYWEINWENKFEYIKMNSKIEKIHMKIRLRALIGI